MGSAGMLSFHIGFPCVCPSVRTSFTFSILSIYKRISFQFAKIAYIKVSLFGILIWKFRKFLTNCKLTKKVFASSSFTFRTILINFTKQIKVTWALYKLRNFFPGAEEGRRLSFPALYT